LRVRNTQDQDGKTENSAKTLHVTSSIFTTGALLTKTRYQEMDKISYAVWTIDMMKTSVFLCGWNVRKGVEEDG